MRQTDSTNKLKLTRRSVEALMSARVQSGPRRYWDTELTGFYLQFTPAGVASFCLRYVKACGAKGDYTIGRASQISPDQAREAARERVAEIVLNGVDPVESRANKRSEARRVKETTFEHVARRYVAARKEQRPGERDLTDEYTLERYVLPHFGRLQVESITRQAVKDLVLSTQALIAKRNLSHVQQRTGRVTANRVHGALRRVFEWALDGELLDKNPAAFKRQFRSKPVKRKGVITQERFRAIWNELEKKAQAKRQTTTLAIQLYMLTLQRPIDIARARRSHFNFETREWRIPWSATKGEQQDYIIPLSEPVMEMIQEALARTAGPYLFPSSGNGRNMHVNPDSMNSRFKRAVHALEDVGAWPSGPRAQLYDFRRYGRTQLVHQLGFTKDVAERVINHAEPSGIDELYDVNDYSAEVRRAHIAWGAEVWRMVHGRPEVA